MGSSKRVTLLRALGHVRSFWPIVSNGAVNVFVRDRAHQQATNRWTAFSCATFHLIFFWATTVVDGAFQNRLAQMTFHILFIGGA